MAISGCTDAIRCVVDQNRECIKSGDICQGSFAWQSMVHNQNGVNRHIFHTTSVDAARKAPLTTTAPESNTHQRDPNFITTFQQPLIGGTKRSLTDAFTPDISGYSADKENVKRPSPSPISRTSSLLLPLYSNKKQTRLQPSEITILRYDDELGDEVPGVMGEGKSEYSQRRLMAATPTEVIDPTLSLGHPAFGLPEVLVNKFKELGVKCIYPWQRNCLLAPNVLTGEKNLIYSAPTGGGKSLVAEVLMFRGVLEEPRAKAILVLPYIALVMEKTRWLRNLVEGLKRPGPEKTEEQKLRNPWRERADADAVRVVGFHGGSKLKAAWNDFEIAVCTIEKANSMINTAIEESVVSNLKTVVLDEIHMIDDGHRGYLMELLTSKLLAIAQPVQIVGMSATISNIELLGRWIDGHTYATKYRPVPIDEHLVYDSKIYHTANTFSLLSTAHKLHVSPSGHKEEKARAIRVIRPSIHKEFQDPVLNAVVALACETANAGFGCLVFSSSRSGCETVAKWISRALPDANDLPLKVFESRLDLIEELRSLSTGLDHVLKETIPYGVGFHHAGMTTEERDLIATAYDNGVLKVCVATCSLAAGINLPARRVILHNARMGRDFVGPSMLRQMRGRAGRKGKDEVGETYLCCREAELEHVVDLMHADLPAISSSLNTDERRVQRALLEAISIRLVATFDSIYEYLSKTLLYTTNPDTDVGKLTQKCIDELIRIDVVKYNTEHDEYHATQLGKAIVASSFDPEDGLFIHRELQRALRSFVMDGDLHVLYNFTPVNVAMVTINWQIFMNEAEKLDESGLRVMEAVGIKMFHIIQLSKGAVLREETDEEKEVARIFKRFYLAFQLRDLCCEVPVHVVAKKYDMPRGMVQTLAQTSQGFAAGMVRFCNIMGWGALGAVLDRFTDRLKAGARDDLLELAKITFVKSRTARIFWENGFKTVASVANASPMELMPVLMQAQPNKLKTPDSKDTEKYTNKLSAKAKIISESANRLWKAELEADRWEEE